MAGVDLLNPTPNRPTSPAATGPPKKISAPVARGFILRAMTAGMITSFYAYTPLWFWPVLWLQIKMMRAHLARLEERSGQPVQALIGLGHCGTLRIVALSDAAAGRYDADHWRPAYRVTLESLTWEPLPDYVWLNILVMRVSAACLPVIARAPRLRSLYLDPG